MTFSGFGNPRLNFPVSLKIGMDWTIQTAESRRPSSLPNTDQIYNCPARTNFFRIFRYLQALINYTNFKAVFFFPNTRCDGKQLAQAVEQFSCTSELAWWNTVLTHNCNLQRPQYFPRRNTHSDDRGEAFPVPGAGQRTNLLLPHWNRCWQVRLQHISYS